MKYNEKHQEKIIGGRQDEMRDEKKEGEGVEGAGNEGDVSTQSGEDVLGFGQRDYMSQTASSAWQITRSTIHEKGSAYRP